MFLDDAVLSVGPARSVVRQGGDWLLLYIEEAVQSPGVIGWFCRRGEVHQCLRTDKTPAVFARISSRVTS